MRGFWFRVRDTLFEHTVEPVVYACFCDRMLNPCQRAPFTWVTARQPLPDCRPTIRQLQPVLRSIVSRMFRRAGSGITIRSPSPRSERIHFKSTRSQAWVQRLVRSSVPPEVPCACVYQTRSKSRDRSGPLIHDVIAVTVMLPCK